MGRSVSKGPYIAYHLLNKINLLNEKGKKETVKTWSRASTILPLEFVPTRTFRSHKKTERKVKR